MMLRVKLVVKNVDPLQIPLIIQMVERSHADVLVSIENSSNLLEPVSVKKVLPQKIMEIPTSIPKKIVKPL